jgi:hypothetical protein
MIAFNFFLLDHNESLSYSMLSEIAGELVRVGFDRNASKLVNEIGSVGASIIIHRIAVDYASCQQPYDNSLLRDIATSLLCRPFDASRSAELTNGSLMTINAYCMLHASNRLLDSSMQDLHQELSEKIIEVFSIYSKHRCRSADRRKDAAFAQLADIAEDIEARFDAERSGSLSFDRQNEEHDDLASVEEESPVNYSTLLPSTRGSRNDPAPRVIKRSQNTSVNAKHTSSKRVCSRNSSNPVESSRSDDVIATDASMEMDVVPRQVSHHPNNNIEGNSASAQATNRAAPKPVASPASSFREVLFDVFREYELEHKAALLFEALESECITKKLYMTEEIDWLYEVISSKEASLKSMGIKAFMRKLQDRLKQL